MAHEWELYAGFRRALRRLNQYDAAEKHGNMVQKPCNGAVFRMEADGLNDTIASHGRLS